MASMAKTRRTSQGAGGADNPWPARLKAIRDHYRLTQREAAERLGTVLRTWQNWEYGRSQPTAATAQAIASTFPMPTE